MHMRKVKQAAVFVFAVLFLTIQMLTAPLCALSVQAAPVTFPDGTVFDPEYYAEANPDVKAAVGTDAVQLWLHYYNFGRKEGRPGVAPGTKAAAATPATKPPAATQAAPAAAKPAAAPAATAAAVTFDPVFYANNNPDIKKALGSDASMLWLHYRMFGEKEGRQAAKNHVPGAKVIAPPNVREIPIPDAAAAATTKQAAAPAKAAESAAALAPVFKAGGKRVAFIGDSITTFGGTLPPGYVPFYPWEGLQNLAETWWYQVSARKGYQVVANASWSACRLTGDRNDPTGRCGSSTARVNAVAVQKPDIVFILIGTNDFTAGVGPYNFKDSYQALITKLRAALPNASIVCCTMIPEHQKWKNSQDLTINDYNQHIRALAVQNGCVLIDTWACGITKEQMIDGLHPNATGAAVMANYIVANLP